MLASSNRLAHAPYRTPAKRVVSDGRVRRSAI
jgi:hypothetical protein